MLTWIPSIHHIPVYPQKEALSILDLMFIWFSLLDLVTKLASPLCRRLLCAAFCCLVSCLRTFWRTTSCGTHNNRGSRLLQALYTRTVCLCRANTTVCRLFLATFFHNLQHHVKTLRQHRQDTPFFLSEVSYFQVFVFCIKTLQPNSCIIHVQLCVFMFYLLVGWWSSSLCCPL